MYAGLGATLVLATFAAASAVAALGLRVLGPRLRVGTAGLPAARRSHRLATLRLFPSALSLLLAGGLVAPAYLAREPRDAGESEKRDVMLQEALHRRSDTLIRPATATAVAKPWSMRSGQLSLDKPETSAVP